LSAIMSAMEATRHCARASAPAATTHAASTEGSEVKPRTPQWWTGGEEGVKREKPWQQPVKKDEAASVGVRATAGKRGNGRNQDTQRQAGRREVATGRWSTWRTGRTQWSGRIAALAGAGGLERFGLVRETGVVVGLTGGG
jgi:hypothetical protein